MLPCTEPEINNLGPGIRWRHRLISGRVFGVVIRHQQSGHWTVSSGSSLLGSRISPVLWQVTQGGFLEAV